MALFRVEQLEACLEKNETEASFFRDSDGSDGTLATTTTTATATATATVTPSSIPPSILHAAVTSSETNSSQQPSSSSSRNSDDRLIRGSEVVFDKDKNKNKDNDNDNKVDDKTEIGRHHLDIHTGLKIYTENVNAETHTHTHTHQQLSLSAAREECARLHHLAVGMSSRNQRQGETIRQLTSILDALRDRERRGA